MGRRRGEKEFLERKMGVSRDVEGLAESSRGTGMEGRDLPSKATGMVEEHGIQSLRISHMNSVGEDSIAAGSSRMNLMLSDPSISDTPARAVM